MLPYWDVPWDRLVCWPASLSPLTTTSCQPLSLFVADKKRPLFHLSRNTPNWRSLPTSDPVLAPTSELPEVTGLALYTANLPALNEPLALSTESTLCTFDLLGFLPRSLGQHTFHSHRPNAARSLRQNLCLCWKL